MLGTGLLEGWGLTRRLRRWNREEIGDIFRRLEVIETSIQELQMEDREGGLADRELADLRGLLSQHHSLLR